MLKIFLIYFFLINIIGVLIMYRDKVKAKHRQYRIREATLWKVAIIGGAIGTTIGMHWFRHKTKHSTFRFGFPALAIVDIGLLLWILFHSHRAAEALPLLLYPF